MRLQNVRVFYELITNSNLSIFYFMKGNKLGNVGKEIKSAMFLCQAVDVKMWKYT